MYVRRLELTDFRSYRSARVDFEPGPSVLVGPNGVGKTNLVEAIGYVATLASHRVAADAPLVRVGAAAAVVRCAIVHEHRELLVELSIEPGRANRVRLGSAPLRRARDVLGALRLVMFAPEDLALVRGDPAERRRYLDDLLVTRQPRFAAVRSDYERVLKQRNALLRTAYLARKAGGAHTGDLSTLDVWDAHLARHGAELLAARIALVAALGPQVAKAYDAVSAGRGAATLAYRSTVGEEATAGSADGPVDGGVPAVRVTDITSARVPDAGPAGATDVAPARAEMEKRLLAALAEARPAEVDRGVTLVGPHRDDLVLHLGGMPARGYASHGESWSLALALRLAGYELLRAEGVEPVLVLDDVFAELDAGRRERLAELVGGASQVLVTCAVEADVPAALRGARYEVSESGVRRV